jgi:preprotein translocase subunit YajC
MRLILGSLVAAGIAISAPIAPASAQAQSNITAGMQVVDATGGAVGTVSSVAGDSLVVKTDRHEVQLPKASFTVNAGKLLFGMTQAQLNAEVEKSLAASNAAIAAGATVKGAGGTPVGQIDAVADGKVTIALSSGQKIQLSQDAVRGNSDGSVTIGFTSDQLEELVAKAGGATSGSAETSGQ